MKTKYKGLPYNRLKSISIYPGHIMTTTCSTTSAFKPAATPSGFGLLRELFRATPLYIFATAVRAAMDKPNKG